MKTVKHIMNESAGFKYIIDDLRIISSSGRKMLFDTAIMKSEDKILKEIAGISEVREQIQEDAGIFENICLKLEQLKDIHLTISNITSGSILNDIDLFEIKQFAILHEDISGLARKLNLKRISFDNLQEVVSILDPEGQCIPHFYIYSSYSTELL